MRALVTTIHVRCNLQNVPLLLFVFHRQEHLSDLTIVKIFFLVIFIFAINGQYHLLILYWFYQYNLRSWIFVHWWSTVYEKMFICESIWVSFEPQVKLCCWVWSISEMLALVPLVLHCKVFAMDCCKEERLSYPIPVIHSTCPRECILL